MKPTNKVKVKLSKGKGPARAKWSIGLQLEFDPVDPEAVRQATDKLFAVLRQFGRPDEVQGIAHELYQKMNEAAEQWRVH